MFRERAEDISPILRVGDLAAGTPTQLVAVGDGLGGPPPSGPDGFSNGQVAAYLEVCHAA